MTSHQDKKARVEKLQMHSLIARKRDGHALSEDEVRLMIDEIVRGQVPNEQIGAMLMAIFLKGLDREETVALTQALRYSGEVLTWDPSIKSLIVDKHSTGGVGDKVSLPLAPALACCGLKVPMISGRGLGHTGGTLDKLESIPGFNIDQSGDKMTEIINSVGCCIVGQTPRLVPGDRILYALRDVTSTVESIPLITSSIVSKKVAEGLNSLILDVKVGRAAFMKTEKEARELARSMVDAGNGSGVNTRALLTRMDHPIGHLIGNSFEIVESIYCLQGKGPRDLEELVCAQGGHLLFINGNAPSVEEGFSRIQKSLHDGSALAKFRDMMIAQGVSEQVAAAVISENPWAVLPCGGMRTPFFSSEGGYVTDIDAMALAIVLRELGAGRLVASDKIKAGVGMDIKVKVGDAITAGALWLELCHEDELSPGQVARIHAAIKLGAEKPHIDSHILDIIV